MPEDTSTALATRKLVYQLLITAAVGIAIGRIAGIENVFEPSRYAPTKSESFGFDRDDKPTRVWPATRPEPTPFFSSNDRSRWATVRSLVDEGTFVIGRRANFRATAPPYGDTGIIFEDGYQSLDKVMNPETGEFFSSKPPLLTVLVAGEYWMLKQTLGWNLDRDRWLVTVTILITWNVLPMLIYLILLARVIEAWGRSDIAKLFTFAVAALGTFLMTFSTTLNNHGPATCAVFFAIYPLIRPRSAGQIESKSDLVLSGFFAGLAATLDLPAAAFSAGVFLPLLYHRPKPTLMLFLPAALLPVAALLMCNFAALGRLLPAYSDFGGPWYNFAGSHWAKLDEVKAGQWYPGLDFAQEPKWLYALHLLIGHHGWFSLTPPWFVALFGLLAGIWYSRSEIRSWFLRSSAEPSLVFSPGRVLFLTLLCSIVVLGFYVAKTNNYGGNTSGPRWLFWLIPLWIFGLLRGIDQIKCTPFARILLMFSFALALLSVYYPMWNPWRSTWIQQLGERSNVLHYDSQPHNLTR